MKQMTREQLEARKSKAIRFARDVREDNELADEIENESLEEYAEHRGIKVLNPKGARKMAQATPTRRELLDQIEELQDQNDALQGKLDAIGDVLAEEEEGEENGDDDE
jgi:hypothetical protein